MPYLVLGFCLIVAFLILVPVPHPPHRQMPKVQAQMTASDLRSAIMMYQTEYKRFPDLPGVEPGSDTVVDTSAASGLISVLVAMPNNALVEKVNRRQIAYFSDRPAKDPMKPGLYRSGADAQLRDPWGNFYLIYMDTNGDEKVEITYPDGKVEIIGSAVIRSLGPNGVIDHTPGVKNDDIFAQ